MRFVKNVLLSFVFLASGCTALLWNGNEVVEHRYGYSTVIEDKVTAAFQYKNLSVTALQGTSSIKVAIPENGVAFLGKKNVYILTSGANDLLALDKISTQYPLVSGFEKKDALRLELKKPDNDDAVLSFSDELFVFVNKTITDHDVETLKQAGFQRKGEDYVKRISLAGVILPREKNNSLFNDMTLLDKPHKVEFYVDNDSTEFHPVNLVTNVVLTPFAAVADIVFFPISIRVLGLITNPPTGR
ncbi:hypothetical protein [Enterobacter cancerogenus]|uniref:hypothetical protein n=1 Tax=Enterobacter cancerogenus TaxID=69218 RepID=UPI000C772D18|nr:hypothetical protein [Enterobacter cancerogenus]AUJ80485.1 hypothetical protein CWI88_05260 [Enterobacter cancerogenus]